MSVRIEGSVIIRGKEEVVGKFISLLMRAHEAMCEDGYFEYKNKTYEFSSEEAYEYDESTLYAFDFPNGGDEHEELLRFLTDMSKKFKGLSFDVLSIYEYGSDLDAMVISQGKAIPHEPFTQKMKEEAELFDWDTYDIPDFINHLTHLIQTEPLLTQK
ncbi:hypothetical protein SUSP_000368 [Sulfurospirillum sp. 'SP']|nr:hypothetical protein [Sulfurospirillum sp. 'SP']WNY97950.1 hypothetical protein SUSP_000368 [Sulfurospirillum sp. 'SP']